VWLDLQLRSSVWMTSITLFEIGSGLQIMPTGKRRDLFTEGFEDFLHRIDNRVASFDHEAAQRACALTASGKSQGRPRESRDTMIAGIVLSRNATFATRNTGDFDDIPAVLIDPWTA
jgi:predicted nucleic acid-binding protein